jgi:hypothetical protein
MGSLSFHTPGMGGPVTDPARLDAWSTNWGELGYLKGEKV